MPRRPRQVRELPGFYYLDHFFELLDFVEQHYRVLLSESECRFIDEFRLLSRAEQGLYARLTNRKGHIFLVTRLKYPEIGPVRPVLDRLEDLDWVAPPRTRDLNGMLLCLTRDHLYRRCNEFGIKVAASARKSDLAEALLCSNTCHDVLLTAYSSDVVVRQRCEALSFLIYLYFGKVSDSLAKFTMRDLGLGRIRSITEDFVARYSDRTEALEYYFFASRIARLKHGEGNPGQLVTELSTWPAPEFPGAARLRDELALKLGKALESEQKHNTLALEVFGVGESLACLEREIRTLFQLGRRDEARDRLLQAMDTGADDETRLFAEDLYARKFDKKRTAVVTDTLRSAVILEFDESQRGSTERAVAARYQAAGGSVFRTENRLWRTLFGLVFWDLLFEQANGLHSPFEFLPAVLADNALRARLGPAIDERLAELEQPGALSRRVLCTAATQFGVDNGVFRWSRRTLDAVHALISAARAESVIRILRRLCGEYRAARAGFPDLMVIQGDDIRFVEVKAEGDQLRCNQLMRLKWLKQAGFGAEVVAVKWIQDPDQVYVVVDVETTGGASDHHRVTEIGAVKIQHGDVIDTYQTLLNPERNIPRRITQLTGITPDMVIDAPRFADIADDFRVFLDGSIFVAHNVNFDYGFIAREFARVDHQLRLPKLCTVVEMRKHYPGLKSYSLAALAERFHIQLDRHHRALCDARAAAELLAITHSRRSGDADDNTVA